MKRHGFVIAIAGIVALFVGVWLGNVLLDRGQSTNVSLGQPAFVYPVPETLKPFALQTHNGEVFDKDRLRDRWTFVFFGYTHCPDVCPMTLDTFRRINALLQAREDGAAPTQFVFVSVDPERDSPQALGEYVGFFDPSFIGVTGNKSEIDRLTAAMHVVYMKIDDKDEGSYLVDHSAAVLLTDPDGNLHAVFTPPHRAEEIVHAFDQIRKARPG